MTRILQLFCLVGATLTSQVSFAEWSANIGVTTDYVWRGYTQNLGKASVSGGADYEDESGLFFGAWASNVDFTEDADGVGTEIDLYLGYSGASGEDDLFGYSITYVQYMYPTHSLRGSGYGELLFDFNASDFIFGLGYTTDAEKSKDTFNEIGDLFFYLGYAGEYDGGWSLTFISAIQLFTTSATEKNDIGNPESNTYIELGVTKSTDFGDFTFSLTKNIEISTHRGAEVAADKVVRPVVSWVMYF